MAHPGGRPTDYTPELAQRICDLIASNPHGIKKLCAMYDDIPSHQCIYEWLNKYREFGDSYLVAKEKQALVVADSLWEESDNLLPISEEINKFNARFRFQQWHLAKLAPKGFGEKKEKEQQSNSDEGIKQLAEAVKLLAAKHEKDY